MTNEEIIKKLRTVESHILTNLLCGRTEGILETLDNSIAEIKDVLDARTVRLKAIQEDMARYNFDDEDQPTVPECLELLTWIKEDVDLQVKSQVAE